MRLSLTLTRYIAKNFMRNFLTIFVIFLTIIFLIDIVELLRRASNNENVGPA